MDKLTALMCPEHATYSNLRGLPPISTKYIPNIFAWIDARKTLLVAFSSFPFFFPTKPILANMTQIS